MDGTTIAALIGALTGGLSLLSNIVRYYHEHMRGAIITKISVGDMSARKGISFLTKGSGPITSVKDVLVVNVYNKSPYNITITHLEITTPMLPKTSIVLTPHTMIGTISPLTTRDLVFSRDVAPGITVATSDNITEEKINKIKYFDLVLPVGRVPKQKRLIRSRKSNVEVFAWIERNLKFWHEGVLAHQDSHHKRRREALL